MHSRRRPSRSSVLCKGTAKPLQQAVKLWCTPPALQSGEVFEDTCHSVNTSLLTRLETLFSLSPPGKQRCRRGCSAVERSPSCAFGFRTASWHAFPHLKSGMVELL